MGNAWRKANHERVRANERRYAAAHVAQRREIAWRQKGIDITVEQYDTLLEKQGARCANPNCRRGPPYKRNLCVDHDHVTGRIRGLLCTYCNRYVVGAFEPNREWLLAYMSLPEEPKSLP